MALTPSGSKAASLIRLAILLGWSSPFFCRAADAQLEYQVKAVFLLNFTKFIEWPAAAFELPVSPVTICILGEDPFGAAKPLPDLGPGVLTVGEGETFTREGGMIGLVIDNRRVRFDVNQTAAERAGLKISSKLLSVARDVQNKAARVR
jgi:hypothetical protein